MNLCTQREELIKERTTNEEECERIKVKLENIEKRLDALKGEHEEAVGQLEKVLFNFEYAIFFP